MAGERVEALVIDPAVVGKEFKRDEQGIAGEGGERGIGGVSVAGGTEGKDLPETLLRGREEISKGVGGGSEIADATERRQRSNVEQETRRAFKGHAGTCQE
jgi:hypothetical protein